MFLFFLGIIIGAALWEALWGDDKTPPPDGDWLLIPRHVWERMVRQAFVWRQMAERNRKLKRAA